MKFHLQCQERMCFLDPRVRSCSFCDKHIKHHTPHFPKCRSKPFISIFFSSRPIGNPILQGFQKATQTNQLATKKRESVKMPEVLKCPKCDANADVTKDGKWAHCASCMYPFDFLISHLILQFHSNIFLGPTKP